MQYIETILRYVFHTVEGMSVEELRAVVETTLSAKQGEVIMTLAEQIKKEGVEQGIQQGIQQGMVQGLVEGIELALSVKFGARGERLMPAVRKVKDPEQLETIKEAIKAARRFSELKELLERVG